MKEHHPMEKFLRIDRIPHMWCSGCGIGASVNCFARAVTECNIDLNSISIVSGIGCSGRVAGYLNLDSYHTTHGRAIPFATGLKLARPDMNVVVISGDGDLTAIGGNHFIHAARRNMDILVICINNFNYAMTGGQCAPTTPLTAKASTMPYGNYEHPFNLPFLAESSGATYVARWTTYHVMHTKNAIKEALQKKGFRFIEIISPCPTLYERRNRLGDGLTRMKFFKENSVVKHGANTKDVDIDFQSDIIVGKFVDEDKATFLEVRNKYLSSIITGYKPWAASLKRADMHVRFTNY